MDRKRIGIFGLGKTGAITYSFLCRDNECICYDDNQSRHCEEFSKVNGYFSVKYLEDPAWQHLEQIVISPGIPHNHKIFELALSHNIEVISDIDILYQENINSKFIAVTGTNGKSTTTALIGHILGVGKESVQTGGNLGIAALSLPKAQNYVLELSSFQLDLTKYLTPHIAILLNITPDHLDRHITMDNYILAKERVFSNLKADGYGIIGLDSIASRNIYEEYTRQGKFNLIPISCKEILKAGVSVCNNILYDKYFENTEIELPVNSSLLGSHNAENIAFSFSACKVMGLSIDEITRGTSSFIGLPHRMQFIKTISGINFYNDSKATNMEAASKSISILDNIYWLVGGIIKEENIESVKPLFNKITKAYIFGKDRETILKMIKNHVDCEVFQNLEEAFKKAVDEATSTRVEEKNILLAPAAASYDQFRDFEHRGEAFIRLVQGAVKLDR